MSDLRAQLPRTQNEAVTNRGDTTMTFDDHRMAELMEESQDLHSTAMRYTHEAVEEIVGAGKERRAAGAIELPDPGRRTFLRRSLLAAGVVGGGALGASMFSRMMTTAD